MDKRSAYAEKLKDPRWQQKRLLILQRDNWSCVLCGKTDQTLHVHHLAYFGEPWDVPAYLLETLCEGCHDERKELNDSLATMFKQMPSQVVSAIHEALEKIFSFYAPDHKQFRKVVARIWITGTEQLLADLDRHFHDDYQI